VQDDFRGGSLEFEEADDSWGTVTTHLCVEKRGRVREGGFVGGRQTEANREAEAEREREERERRKKKAHLLMTRSDPPVNRKCDWPSVGW
jgi:hypothetical protein